MTRSITPEPRSAGGARPLSQGPRARGPLPLPHPPASGRRPHLGDRRLSPVLQLPDHRPLGQAVPRRGDGGPGRAQARPTLSLRRRLDRRRRRVGHRDRPPRLRLPPQPLVLRGRRPADLREPTASRSAARRSAAGCIEGGLVYRRPRPVLGPTDEQREAKLAALRRLLAGLPADETAVFQDEVDINTNPKIGSMWMAKGSSGDRRDAGQQREAIPLRVDPLADRPGVRHRGQAEAGPRHGPVPGPPRRPAVPAPSLHARSM